MSEQQSPVLASVRNRVGHLTLNRPSALNTLDLPMVCLLCRHLWVWEQDPEIVAMTIRGAGEKAFCAGGDIRMLYDSHKAGDNMHELLLEEEYALDEYLHGYSKPVLAMSKVFSMPCWVSSMLLPLLPPTRWRHWPKATWRGITHFSTLPCHWGD
jgi:enoyl-CoA hydratase/carnithine racemase